MHEAYPDSHHDTYSKTIFGFWCYLLTDFMMFATFFAAYAVLKNNVYGGPSTKDLFQLPYILQLTLLMLTAGFTSGLAGIAAHRGSRKGVIGWLLLTLLLGAFFLGMEISEWSQWLARGHGWQRSAFLSAYFTIVGMHAIHIIFALLWTIVFLIPLFMHTITPTDVRRIACLRMFWQFLAILWGFIYTIIYLIGAL